MRRRLGTDRRGTGRLGVAAAGIAALVAGLLSAPAAQAAAPDPFYSYHGSTPLAQLAPGTVLKTRTVSYHLAGIALPLSVVQLLFRSTNAVGAADLGVTSVLQSPVPASTPKVVSYQSFYDSLNPDDEPSRVFAGESSGTGGSIASAEAAFLVPFLLQGYTVVVGDTEGQTADFAAGPEYGTATLDSLRAAYRSPVVGIPAGTKAALYGYSGGAIATEWAAQLAPTYAPDVNRKLIGASYGGVLVDPAHNLHYVDGSTIWAGVIPVALIGIARAYHIDLTPYLSAYGRTLNTKLQNASIGNVLGQYPGLTFAQLAKPAYAQPESIPAYVRVANKLIMGSSGRPTIPMYIEQGAKGELEGTPGDKPGIGPGDGVMIAGDVRTLARKYCKAGLAVQYVQDDATSHTTTAPLWSSATVQWISDRFAGTPAPQNCSTIAPGNPLTPIPSP